VEKVGPGDHEAEVNKLMEGRFRRPYYSIIPYYYIIQARLGSIEVRAKVTPIEL
jgi:hypothetical protein